MWHKQNMSTLLLFKVLEDVHSDASFPKVSRSTLWRALQNLGFRFKKRGRNSTLLERTDLILWRAQYLRAIKAYRAEGRPIYFLDETWANAGHTRSKVWTDTTVKAPRDAYNRGLSLGLKNPSGKGGRVIILHAGSEDGFVEGAAEVFRAKKGTGDYHQEMDGKRFEKWLTEKLLPNIKAHSVIVMDNASYHSVKLNACPSSSTLKKDVQGWLTLHGVSWDSTMLKVELLNLVKMEKVRRPELEKCRVDAIAEQRGHVVLRLPPYHCELNPIELVWSQVKGYIASRNVTFKLADVEALTPVALQQVTAENWSSYVHHAIGVEERMWADDGLVDIASDRLVIETDEDSTTDSSDDEDMGCDTLEW
ncbi:uncharacterized protein LOC115328335 [Ixodes scapularis]|uniref:uncharacterized protein LOC115328335 n=1 Tax=Ixodes scapularis TaxID=6945 RepID=UPI001C384C2A|nr:uncharacterized protein LOC115328335 [Ixodes scapularis]